MNRQRYQELYRAERILRQRNDESTLEGRKLLKEAFKARAGMSTQDACDIQYAYELSNLDFTGFVNRMNECLFQTGIANMQARYAIRLLRILRAKAMPFIPIKKVVA